MQLAVYEHMFGGLVGPSARAVWGVEAWDFSAMEVGCEADAFCTYVSRQRAFGLMKVCPELDRVPGDARALRWGSVCLRYRLLVGLPFRFPLCLKVLA